MKNFVLKSSDKWSAKKAFSNLLLPCLILCMGSTGLLGETIELAPHSEVGSKENVGPKPENQPLQVTLAYGDHLTLEGPLENISSWTILHSGQTVGQGIGNSLLNFVFAQPGEYSVQIQDNHVHNAQSCDHSNLPSEILVTVTGKKMVFDFTQVTFSAPISNGNLNGIVLSVPVIVDSYDGSPILFQQGTVYTAGVGTNLTAIPVQNVMSLNPGTVVLNYTLSGSVSRPTYIMFDFIDVNGKVQSFGLQQQIH